MSLKVVLGLFSLSIDGDFFSWKLPCEADLLRGRKPLRENLRFRLSREVAGYQSSEKF